jgi:alanyl-tRNA synthetase
MTWDVENFVYDTRLAETFVTYPLADIESTGPCVGIATLRADTGEGLTGIITEATAIHPISSTWPDQPADKGFISLDGEKFDLAGAIEATVGHVGSEMAIYPGVAKRRVDAEEPFEVVLHLVLGTVPVGIGSHVELSADRDFRLRLSRGHSICHLQAIALNEALSSYWKKPVDQLDSLGVPDFDQIAIESSTIHEDFSVDVYRMGRSLRKKGFDTERLVNDHEDIRSASEGQLREWISAGYEIEVFGGQGQLGDRRKWLCKMASATAAIPCGGTHVPNTG